MVYTDVVCVKLKVKVKIVKVKTSVFVRSCIRVVHTDGVMVAQLEAGSFDVI